MKKLFLLSVFSFALFSCSNKESNIQEEKNILFATPLKEHEVWLKAKDGLDDVCSANNLNCEWQGPVVIDTDAMNDTIETGIMKKVDGIITQGVVSEELVNRAVEMNIPVVLVDSDMPNSKRTFYMGKDFHKQAEMFLSDIEKHLGKDTYLKVAIQVADASFNIAKDQIKEIKDVFSKHRGGFEIVSVSQSRSDSVRAKKEWERVLNEENDINVAINFAGESAPFCSEAAKELNLREQMLIYGVDDLDNTLQGVKNGDIDGTIVTSFYDYGYQSVEIILDYLNDKKIERDYSPKLELLTKENISAYEKK
jgi:hypothetical protein